MALNGMEARLRDRVDAFVADLAELLRSEALETIQEALAGTPAKPAPRKSVQRKSKKTTSRKAGRRGRRGRRTADDLEATCAELMQYVQANPGQRLEVISAELGSSSKVLRRPVQMLMARGELRTEGQKRGTTYFPGDGRVRRKAGRKAGKKAGRKAGKKKTTRRKATVKRAA